MRKLSNDTAAEYLRRTAIQDIMIRYEMESDEGGTAWDKAEAIYEKNIKDRVWRGIAKRKAETVLKTKHSKS